MSSAGGKRRLEPLETSQFVSRVDGSVMGTLLREQLLSMDVRIRSETES